MSGGGRAAQQEVVRLLTLDSASYLTGLEGGILPPSPCFGVTPGFPAKRSEPRIERGKHSPDRLPQRFRDEP